MGHTHYCNCVMTREEKIEFLVQETLENFQEFPFGLLEYYLISGFIGFANFTDEQLDKEILEIKAIKGA